MKVKLTQREPTQAAPDDATKALVELVRAAEKVLIQSGECRMDRLIESGMHDLTQALYRLLATPEGAALIRQAEERGTMIDTDPVKAVARALVRHRGDSEHEPYADTCQECLTEARAAIAAYREALEASEPARVSETLASLRALYQHVQGGHPLVNYALDASRLSRAIETIEAYQSLLSAAPKPTEQADERREML